MCALGNDIDVDSFIAKTHVIFPFLVAWKRARKVDYESLERGLNFGAFFRGYRSSYFPRFSEKSGL